MGSCQSDLCDKNSNYKTNFDSFQSTEKYVKSNPEVTTNKLKKCDHYNEGGNPGLYFLLEYFICKRSLHDVKNLVNTGLDINRELPIVKKTPLIYALSLAAGDQLKTYFPSYLIESIVKYLLQQGANANYSHQEKIIFLNTTAIIPPLFYAIAARNVNIITELLQYKANINGTYNGKSILYMLFQTADETNHKETMSLLKVLCTNNVNVNAKNSKGYTIMHLLFIEFFHRLTSGQLIEIMNVLVIYGSYLDNIQDNDGNTVLHLLFKLRLNYFNKDNYVKAIEALANGFANSRIKNKNGQTALDILLEYKTRFAPDDFYDIFLRFVQLGADINSGIQGCNALHLLLYESLSVKEIFNTMQSLIRFGINVNTVGTFNITGDTILHLFIKLVACKCSSEEFVKILTFLESSGVNMNVVNNKGDTALHLLFYLVNKKKFETTDYLIAINILTQNGCAIQCTNKKGDTALSIFIPLFDSFGSKGYFQILSHLLQLKADVNGKDEFGNTPLHLLSHRAIKSMKWEDLTDLFKLMINFKANVNAQNLDGNTALHLTLFKVWNNHPAPDEHLWHAINVLITSGANVLLRNNEQFSALDIVLRQGFTVYDPDWFFQVVFCLVQSNAADINTKVNGITLLHLLLSEKCIESLKPENFLEIMNRLILLGIDVNATDYNGNTILHTLFQSAVNKFTPNNFIEILKEILYHGADVDIQDRNGHTALHLFLLFSSACDSNRFLIHDYSFIMNVLSNNGSNLEIKNKYKRTALLILINDAVITRSERFLQIVNHLLLSGANVNAIDEFRNSALHNMLRPSFIKKFPPKTFAELIKSAIEFRADVNAINSTDQTILHLLLTEENVKSLNDEFLLTLNTILDSEIDVNAENANSQSPLWYTLQQIRAYNAQLQILQALISHGASTVDSFDGIPYLHKMMKDGYSYWWTNENIQEITNLCELFSDHIDIEDSQGWTPLFYAAKNLHLQFVITLVEQGAKLDRICNEISIIQQCFQSICQFDSQFSEENVISLVKYLIERDISINSINSNKCPLLHEIIDAELRNSFNHSTFSIKFIGLLLDAGINWRITYENGLSCVDLLLQHRPIEIFNFFLSFCRHMIKLECFLGTRIQPINKWESIYRKTTVQEKYKAEMRDYRDSCIKEIKILKMYYVSSVRQLFNQFENKRLKICSFYDVLSMSKQRLAKMANFNDFRLSSLNNYEKLFPIYGVMLFQKIKSVKHLSNDVNSIE